MLSICILHDNLNDGIDKQTIDKDKKKGLV